MCCADIGQITDATTPESDYPILAQLITLIRARSLHLSVEPLLLIIGHSRESNVGDVNHALGLSLSAC